MYEIEISIAILKIGAALILYGILAVIFIHILGKKINFVGEHTGKAFLLSLGIVFAIIIQMKAGLTILFKETNFIFMIIPIGVGLVLVFLGDYFSEKMSQQQYRSFYHAVYGLIVAGVLLISSNIAFLFLSLSFMLLLMAEYVRKSDGTGNVSLYVKKILNKPVREYEERGYVASFSYTAGMLLVILFLPLKFAIGSALILSLGDPAAAVIGKRYGKHKFRHNPDKSLEGSIAMFTVSFISLSFLSISVSVVLFASVSAVILESFDLKASDNLLIPIFAGIVMSSLVV